MKSQDGGSGINSFWSCANTKKIIFTTSRENPSFEIYIDSTIEIIAIQKQRLVLFLPHWRWAFKAPSVMLATVWFTLLLLGSHFHLTSISASGICVSNLGRTDAEKSQVFWNYIDATTLHLFATVGHCLWHSTRRWPLTKQMKASSTPARYNVVIAMCILRPIIHFVLWILFQQASSWSIFYFGLWTKNFYTGDWVPLDIFLMILSDNPSHLCVHTLFVMILQVSILTTVILIHFMLFLHICFRCSHIQ